MKVVFDTKPTSRYDDDVVRHYQFPRRYLKLAERGVGDWAVLRRPRADGGDKGYFAVAKVVSVEPDVERTGLYYAHLGDYLAFDVVVPWLDKGRYWERNLRDIPQTSVGLFLRGKSVRALEETDFCDIILRGFEPTLSPGNEAATQIPDRFLTDLRNALDSPAPAGERERSVQTILTNRIVRDAHFRLNVSDAYDGRCAVTGLRIADRCGHSEAQAAHIWAVADGGPDVVQNGIALSSTLHWMFDRYLFSITDDYRLLVDETLIPLELRALFDMSEMRLRLPIDPKLWPHPDYIRRHRELYLKAMA